MPLIRADHGFVPDHLLDHLSDQLRRPDPTLGWNGDPLLSLAYNRLTDLWAVVRERPDGSGGYDVICRQRTPGQRLEVASVIRRLVDQDTHRAGNSALERAVQRQKDNEALEARKAQEAAEMDAEMRLKLTRGIISDLGNSYVGYVPPMTVSEKPWEKSADASTE